MLLYTIGLQLYVFAIHLASLFNKKASAWIEGRRLQAPLFKVALPKDNRAWFHFASLGEFEQGREIIERLHTQDPTLKFVITFFSPSGYEIRKNYALAEKVYYLPIDSAANAKELLDHIQPRFIFFNKYEYWHHYLAEAKSRKIPVFINAAIFRKEQIYFKWYGDFYRRILANVTQFFCQDLESVQLLQSIGINNCSISGDTRFDRVDSLASNSKPAAELIDFTKDQKVFIAGSTWAQDESIIAQIIPHFPAFKFIIVPHEIVEHKIQQLQKVLNVPSVRLSNYVVGATEPVLIVDGVGYLNAAYGLARYSYIGGGFGKGIHNTLEAATYGMPIYFGPKYQKFKEAKDLIKLGAAHSLSNAETIIHSIRHFEQNDDAYQIASRNAKSYVAEHAGASDGIISELRKRSLLN